MRNILILLCAASLIFTGCDSTDSSNNTAVDPLNNDNSSDTITDIDAQNTDNLSTIPEPAQAAGNFMTLLSAVEAAGLADTLLGDGPFTVLAPSDDAFQAVGNDTLNTLMTGAMNGEDDLANILKLHVISGEVFSSDLTDGMIATTLNGDLTVAIGDDGVVATS